MPLNLKAWEGTGEQPLKTDVLAESNARKHLSHEHSKVLQPQLLRPQPAALLHPLLRRRHVQRGQTGPGQPKLIGSCWAEARSAETGARRQGQVGGRRTSDMARAGALAKDE